MKMNFVLTRIWGIPIGLHFSWLIIFGLLMFTLATGVLPAGLPGLPQFAITLLALATSLLFFGSLLAHELGHAFVALREKIPVRSISLFIFGGVAQIDKEPESAGGVPHRGCRSAGQFRPGRPLLCADLAAAAGSDQLPGRLAGAH